MKNYYAILLLIVSTSLYSQDWFVDLKIELPDGSAADTIRLGCSENALTSFNVGLDVIDTTHSFPLAAGLFVDDAPVSSDNCGINVQTKFLPFPLGNVVTFTVEVFAEEQFGSEDIIVSCADPEQLLVESDNRRLTLMFVNSITGVIDFADNNEPTVIYDFDTDASQINTQFMTLGGGRLGSPNSCGFPSDLTRHRNSIFTVSLVFETITSINEVKTEPIAFVQLLNDGLNINFKESFTGKILYFDTLGRLSLSENFNKSIDELFIDKSQLNRIAFLKVISNNPKKVSQTIKTPPF